MIYSPEVPVGATPPANYPPTLSARKELKAIAFFSTASVTAELLLAAPPYIPAGSVGFAALALLCTASFAVVSGVYLGRAHYFGSRYARADGGGGDRCFGHSREWMKMLALLPVVYLCALRDVLNTNSIRVITLGMWIGTHVVYLDKFTVLQSFGCKVVRGVNGVLEMNWRELAVFTSFGAFLVFVVSVIGNKLIHDKAAQLRILLIYASLTIILVAVKNLPSLRKSAFHSHHYFNSLLFLPLTSFGDSDSFSALLCGLGLGSFVEGCACWGVDPIFHYPLSESVDFGVVFWTSLVPIFTSDRAVRCFDFLCNVQPLAAAAERAAIAKMPIRIPCLARVGADSALKRAQRFATDLEYVKSKIPLELRRNCTGVKPEIASLIDSMEFGHDRAVFLLAYAETVLLGLMLGGPDLSKMTSTSSSIRLTCLEFSDKALCDVPNLQRKFRRLRRSIIDAGQKDLLVDAKRRIVLGLLDCD